MKHREFKNVSNITKLVRVELDSNLDSLLQCEYYIFSWYNMLRLSILKTLKYKICIVSQLEAFTLESFNML